MNLYIKLLSWEKYSKNFRSYPSRAPGPPQKTLWQLSQFNSKLERIDV